MVVPLGRVVVGKRKYQFGNYLPTLRTARKPEVKYLFINETFTNVHEGVVVSVGGNELTVLWQ